MSNMSDAFNLNDPQVLITFSNTTSGELVGQLIERDGCLVFEGNADESAQYFFTWICEHFNERMRELKKANNN